MSRWLGVFGALIGFSGLLGCGSSSDSAAAGSGGLGGSGGGAPTELPATLGFDPASNLLSTPGEEHLVTVVATPPRAYTVRLALLGGFQDGSLDRGEVVTGGDGRGTFRLVAPTQATTFSVQASVGDQVFAKLGVSVSSSGFANLTVKPSYGGKRSVGTWTASARSGTTCAGLKGNPPEDGDLIGTAPANESPVIAGVPVGPALAITLRSGYYLSGCQDIGALVVDGPNAVTVTVTDVPMQLGQTDLQVSFELGPPGSSWPTAFSSALSHVEPALRDGAPDDVGALLDAMAEASGPAQSDFTALRGQEAWDDTLALLFGASSADVILTAVTEWLNTGMADLTGRNLDGQLVAENSTGNAYLHLQSFAGSPILDAGFPSQAFASLAADPGDTLLLGTKLFFVPSRALAAVALAPALAAEPGALSVAEALAAKLPCTSVSTELVAAGPDPLNAYDGCDASCVQVLCEQALVTLWTRVRDASTVDPSLVGVLQLSATGAASVDETARPAAAIGSWVGTLSVGQAATSVGGAMTAGKPLPPR